MLAAARRTIRDRLCEGLEALGFERTVNVRTKRYDVYQQLDGKLWYVGRNGALRIGTTIDNSASATPVTRDYILSVRTVRPVVDAQLTRKPPKQNVDLDRLTADTIKANAELGGIPARIVRLHVRQWLRDHRIEYRLGARL